MFKLIKPKTNSEIAVNEPLNGNIDGINKLFSTNNNFKSGNINIFYNGQLLSDNDFEELGNNEISFIYFAPEEGSILLSTYEKDS